jgi:type IV pilus assembly protein PilM
MGLSKKTNVIGIDIGSHSIKVVQLIKKRKNYELANVASIHLPENTFEEGMTENPNLVTDAIKHLITSEKIKTKYAVTSLSGESVVIKKITVPQMSEEALSESIMIEAAQYIPFDINDVNVDFTILGPVEKDPDEDEIEDEEEMGEQIEVLLVAAKKDIIDQRNSILTNAGLVPVVFDLDVFAIENSFSLNYEIEKDKVIGIINVGASVTNINIMEGGNTGFTRDILVGGNQYTETIGNRLKMDFNNAEKVKLGANVKEEQKDEIIPVIMDVVDSLASEIQKSIEFYSTAANRNIDSIYLSGGTSKISGINHLLNKKLGIDVVTLDPLKKISVNKKRFDPEYIASISPTIAVATGLAFRRFDDID